MANIYSLLIALLLLVGHQNSLQAEESATLNVTTEQLRAIQSGDSNDNKVAATDVAHSLSEDKQTEIEFYLSKLSDRSYTQTYGEEGQGVWYTAAEKLGAIGEPAIPHLIKKLESTDPYELKLAIYALLLASSDPVVKAKTGGKRVRIDMVLDEKYNTENKKIALEWWGKHQSLFKKP